MRALTTLLIVGVVAAAGAADLVSSPYVSFADSPFFGGAFASFHLEDFEDGAFNQPNAAISGGVASMPGMNTDSVDADDGAIDGSGIGGHSWHSANALNAISVNFAPVSGQYPTHAGLVWTDVGQSATFGYGAVQFEAFGPGNVLLGSLLMTLGDGAITGGTAEDRFFGVTELTGVASIRLTMAGSQDWELDHVQFGTVPEPGTFVSALLIAALGMARRR